MFARLLVLIALVLVRGAAAQAPMIYIHNGPESPDDARYNYHWEILRVALEKTIPEYGPYLLESAPAMSERRQVFELRQAKGNLTVMYLGTTPEMERELLPVRIPVDRGLGGYSVFLIRKERQAELAKVRTLDDLRRFSFGLGLGWIDVEIFQASRLRTVTGSSYDGLFQMLDNGRFDVFPRALVEILGEFTVRKDKMPDLMIEPTLMLYYTMPMYFWFPRTPQGQRQAERAEKGMRRMIADGTYLEIFSTYQGYKIRELKLGERRIIAIPNPLLGKETPFADRALWFNPHDYRPRK